MRNGYRERLHDAFLAPLSYIKRRMASKPAREGLEQEAKRESKVKN